MKRTMMTIPDVMNRLNLSYSTVNALITSVRLRAMKVGRWRVDPDDLEAFIEAEKQARAPRPKRPLIDADLRLKHDHNRFLE